MSPARGRRVAGVLAALLAGSLTACSSPTESYCSVVEEQQQPLSESIGAGGPAALLASLPSLRSLQEASPDDIRGDWDVVVGRLGRLAEALDDAGVDPATYDRTDPPAGLGDDQRSAIEGAARRLATPEMVTALEAVQQQARDVCKTPLVL